MTGLDVTPSSYDTQVGLPRVSSVRAGMGPSRLVRFTMPGTWQIHRFWFYDLANK